MDPDVHSADENNWKSTFSPLHRQNILRMVNRMARLLLNFKEIKVTSELPTQSSANPSRLQNSTLQQSNQQLLATNFFQASNQTISSLQNNSIEVKREVPIQMGNPMGSPPSDQIPNGSMCNQLNMTMPHQMNTSIDWPSATITINGPVQMAHNKDNSISGLLGSDGKLANNTDTPEKKMISRRMARMKHFGGRFSLPLSSQLGSAPQNNIPDSQCMAAGPMRIKYQRVLCNRIAYRILDGQNSSPNVNRIQLHSQTPYELLRRNANDRADTLIKRFVLPQSRKISGINFDIKLSTQDERAYQDKIKELGRYLGPIKKMISTLGIGEVEKIIKLKRLLQILTSPHSRRSRTTLQALLKIEGVLKKLDMKLAEQQIQINEQNRLIDEISLSLERTSI